VLLSCIFGKIVYILQYNRKITVKLFTSLFSLTIAITCYVSLVGATNCLKLIMFNLLIVLSGTTTSCLKNCLS